MTATITSSDTERVPFWSALIRDRRMAPALGLGFTSGMPFLLTYSTQSAWLTDAGVPLATIGLLSELTLAYKFKFVWAPFLDQYDPPLIGHVLDRQLSGHVHAVCNVIGSRRARSARVAAGRSSSSFRTRAACERGNDSAPPAGIDCGPMPETVVT